jgi:hypothetical protein
MTNRKNPGRAPRLMMTPVHNCIAILASTSFVCSDRLQLGQLSKQLPESGFLFASTLRSLSP